MLYNQYLNTISARARAGQAKAFAMALAMLSVVASTGCGSAPASSATPQIDPAFSDYVNRFEQASAQAGRPTQVSNVSMAFGQVASEGEADGRGQCVIVTGQTPTVTISPDAWNSSTDAEREQLVFHELGHCVFGLVHVAGITDQGIPQSIMDPSEISGAIYTQYHAYYMTTLFQQ